MNRDDPSPESTGPVLRVLVVEDDAGVRKLVASVLSNMGLDVVAASNGARALTIAEDRLADFDLLLTDVVMPGISGVDLADQLTSRNPRLRVLFMTGYSGRMKDDLAGREAQILSKPFTLSTLKDTVLGALEHPD